MTILDWFDGLLLAGSAAGAVVLVWCYCAGNAWWKSRVGRALVGLSAGLVQILGYAALKRFFGWPTIPVVQLALYAEVLVIMIGLDAAFIRERRDQRIKSKHDQPQ